MSPSFEFEAIKSDAILVKHGIDFIEAQALWEDPQAVVIKARSDSEARFALIASCKDRVWSAFYTERENKVRIISVRRARTNEERLYYGR